MLVVSAAARAQQYEEPPPPPPPDDDVQAPAAPEGQPSQQTFDQQLAPYGHWVVTPDYGHVWVPAVSSDWQPYSDGRWVDTEWEPYISVALCSGVALAFTMTLSGVLNLLGSS